MSKGLRNWRGEIIQSEAAVSEGDKGEDSYEANAIGSRSPGTYRVLSLNERETTIVSAVEERRPAQKKVLQDEFGRDVELLVDEKRRKSDQKKDKKHKYKKRKHNRGKRTSRSRSLSPQGRLVGTPPPPDPFRPQLDEGRSRRPQRGHHEMSRSGNVSRSRNRRHYSRSRSPTSRDSDHHRHHRRRSFSRDRGRSQGRNRSRSPIFSRSRRRRSSASVERKWTHNAYDDRSPSPARQTDPLYKPEPEAWVSRAGGVYLPRN